MFRATFGQFSFPNLVELSCLALIATAPGPENSQQEDSCVGVLAVNDLNNSSGEFDKTLEALRGVVPCSTANSLFLSFLCVDPKAVDGVDVSLELVNKAFTTFPEVTRTSYNSPWKYHRFTRALSQVDFLFWFCPATAKLPPYVLNLFTEMDPQRIKASVGSQHSALFKGQRVYVAHRSRFVPRLQVLLEPVAT